MPPVHWTGTADFSKFVSEVNKAIAKLEQQNAKLRDQRREAKSAGGALDGMAASLGKFATAGAALALVLQNLKDIEQQAENSANRITELTNELKLLAQVSGGSPEEFARQQAIAKEISRTTGAKEVESIATVRRGIGAGLSEEDIRLIAATSKFEPETARLIDALDQLRDVFGKGVAGGTVEGLLNLLGATLPARPGASMAQIGESIAKQAELGEKIGADVTQLAAIMSVLTSQVGEPAAEKHVQQLFRRLLISKDFGDPGEDAITKLTRFFAENEARQRAIAGPKAELARQTIAENMPAIIGAAGVIGRAVAETGQPGAFVRRMETTVGGDPRLSGVEATRRSFESKEQAMEPAALRKFRRDTITNVIREQIAATGVDFVSRASAEAQIFTGNLLGSESILRATLAGLPGVQSSQRANRLIDAAMRPSTTFNQNCKFIWPWGFHIPAETFNGESRRERRGAG